MTETQLTAVEKALSDKKEQPRTVPEVMLDWQSSRNPRRRKIAREYWDDFESGRPMGDDDR